MIWGSNGDMSAIYRAVHLCAIFVLQHVNSSHTGFRAVRSDLVSGQIHWMEIHFHRHNSHKCFFITLNNSVEIRLTMDRNLAKNKHATFGGNPQNGVKLHYCKHYLFIQTYIYTAVYPHTYLLFNMFLLSRLPAWHKYYSVFSHSSAPT